MPLRFSKHENHNSTETDVYCLGCKFLATLDHVREMVIHMQWLFHRRAFKWPCMWMRFSELSEIFTLYRKIILKRTRELIKLASFSTISNKIPNRIWSSFAWLTLSIGLFLAKMNNELHSWNTPLLVLTTWICMLDYFVENGGYVRGLTRNCALLLKFIWLFGIRSPDDYIHSTTQRHSKAEVWLYSQSVSVLYDP